MKEPQEIVVDPSLVAYCGLYCGACPSYRKGKCPGCAENHKATWCKVRTCCREASFVSCAECTDPKDPRDCKKYSNFVASLFGFFLRSDRRACILQIRELGIQAHTEDMAKRGCVTIKR